MTGLTMKWVKFYRERGYNPLPSSTVAKKPLCTYAEYWDKPVPGDLFDRFPTTNIQVMTGAARRLLVVDLDGVELGAMCEWLRMSQSQCLPDTWVSRSGNGGMHLWYSTPAGMTLPLSKCKLWQGDRDHEAIEVLFNRCLVVAPPSIHPKTGIPYSFLPGYDPQYFSSPAPLPSWLRTKLEQRVASHCVRHMQEPLSAVEGAITLAKSWGVRFTGKHRNDWWECHAVDRDDNNPSAAVHAKSGVYVDSGQSVKLSLANLAIRMGIYRTYREALSAIQGGQRCAASTITTSGVRSISS